PTSASRPGSGTTTSNTSASSQPSPSRGRRSGAGGWNPPAIASISTVVTSSPPANTGAPISSGRLRSSPIESGFWVPNGKPSPVTVQTSASVKYAAAQPAAAYPIQSLQCRWAGSWRLVSVVAVMPPPSSAKRRPASPYRGNPLPRAGEMPPGSGAAGSGAAGSGAAGSGAAGSGAAGSGAGGDEPGLVRGDHGLGPVPGGELGQHVADVGLDGLRPYHQPVGDLGVGQSGGHQPQYLRLPRGEAGHRRAPVRAPAPGGDQAPQRLRKHQRLAPRHHPYRRSEERRVGKDGGRR